MPDLEEACARFEKLGVQFKKRPQDGKMKTIAFILGEWLWQRVLADPSGRDFVVADPF